MTATSQFKRNGALPKPLLEHGEYGAPRSVHFGDTYFDQQDGLAESRHVFLEGCDLPDVWIDKARYVIGETGFGTGLNFLATWQLWQQTAPSTAALHYVSIEGFPLAADELEGCHTQWPRLNRLKAELIASYPCLQRGYHRLFLDNSRVILTLIFDDVFPALQSLETAMDAWFLDGFAPRQNPDMWHPDVLNAVGRLSKTGTRLATFTVAGQVRRDLESAGFSLEKRGGFGKKREVLKGIAKGRAKTQYAEPYFAPPPTLAKRKPSVSIIGGGLAGAHTAHAFNRRGCDVTVYESRETVGSEASAVPAGVVMPRLTAAKSVDGDYYAAAWPFALAHIQHIEKEHSSNFLHRCGVLQLASVPEEARRLAKIASSGFLADDFVQYVEAKEASSIAGIPLTQSALYFPQGGWIRSTELCQALTSGARVVADAAVLRLDRDGERWRLVGHEGQDLGTSDIVVVACGMETGKFSQMSHLPLTPRVGQLSDLRASTRSGHLKCILAGNGHITPPIDGRHSVGATFDQVTSVDGGDYHKTEAEGAHTRNLEKAKSLLPDVFEDDPMVDDGGWRAVRCTTPDHLPVAGPAPDLDAYRESYDDLRHGRHWVTYPSATYHPGLFILTGLGSRGLTTAPLAADLIASQAVGDPPPVPKQLVQALHPGRFIVRHLKQT